MANVIFKELTKAEIDDLPITDGSIYFNTTDEDILVDLNGIRKRYAGGNLSNTDIIDNLTTNNATVPLSAKQGKVLQDTKQANITGGASTVTTNNLTSSRALISNGSGKIAVSTTTSTEIGRLSGVTANVQDQINQLNQTIQDLTQQINTNISQQIIIESVMIKTDNWGSGSHGVLNKTVTKSGYTPIGIAGVTFYQSFTVPPNLTPIDEPDFLIHSFKIIGNKAYVSYSVKGSSSEIASIINGTLAVDVIYTKNVSS